MLTYLIIIPRNIIEMILRNSIEQKDVKLANKFLFLARGRETNNYNLQLGSSYKNP